MMDISELLPKQVVLPLEEGVEITKVVLRPGKGADLFLGASPVSIEFGSNPTTLMQQFHQSTGVENTSGTQDVPDDLDQLFIGSVCLSFVNQELGFIETPTAREDAPQLEILDPAGTSLVAGRPTAEDLFAALGDAVTSSSGNVINEPVWPQLGVVGWRESNPEELEAEFADEEFADQGENMAWWQENLERSRYFETVSLASRSYLEDGREHYLPAGYSFE